MGLSKKFVLLFAIGSLPVLFMYQNCSKTQNFEMQDMTSLKADGSLPFDSGVLEPGQQAELGDPPREYQVEPRDVVDGSNSGLGSADSGSGSSGSDSSEQAPSSNNSGSDPEVLADCSSYIKESQNENASASFSNDSASGVQGFKVLSPEDFGGNRNIKSISNTGGHIVLCNLEVESYSDSNGRVDLVNSHAVFVNFKGTVKVDGGEEESLDASSASVAKGKK
jgi:hypothetical protein